MNNRAGKTVEVLGKYYSAFEPSPIPSMNELEIDSEIATLIGEANNMLGVLNGLSRGIPDIHLFVSSYVRKEALLSSQIEGTQASLVDVLDPSIEDTANLDVLDVVNYTNALDYAVNRLKDYPLCNRLLKETHKVLLEGTRGGERCPGEFRHSQNWIGSSGSNINNARYVPPTPECMIEAMSDLEKYINDSEDNILIKAGLVHYQFETIHPFLDGNGRVGRMLIVLMLLNEHVLTYPILYISYYLKKNRVEYYDRLEAVRKNGNYEQWLKFFLRMIIETSKDSICTIDSLIDLKKKYDELMSRESYSTQKVYKYIWSHPIIDVSKTSDELNISYNTVSRAISMMVAHGILMSNDTKNRNRTFTFGEYLDILKRDTENV